ncbi:hypothetical protein K2X33_10230, partial [bacterium]|nr:hypothetical protein [bacterium]
DNNGNLTTDQTGKQYVYDAWQRVVTVKNAGGATIQSFTYDALGRRITENSGTATDLYYNDRWQVIEERVGGTHRASYVWDPTAVDRLINRLRDTDANGTLDESLWPLYDAQGNVTALVNNAGAVQERYVYDPYGVPSVYDASWNTRGSSSYGWVYLHQGLRYDTVSLTYDNRERLLSPALGRFLQEDPIGLAAGTNVYAYVNGNPTNLTDPSGLQSYGGYPSYPGGGHGPYGGSPGGGHYNGYPPPPTSNYTPRYNGLGGPLPPPYGPSLAPSAVQLPFSNLEIFQFILDVVGIFDPTPLSDGTNAAIYAYNGDYTNAGVSAAGAGLPYVGDLLKVGKYVNKFRKAIGIAEKTSECAIKAPSRWALVSADTLRSQGRRTHNQIYKSLHTEAERAAAKAGENLLEVHHRIPLEYRHLFDGDPNRISNLVGLHRNVHAEVSGMWTAFRSANPNPTQAQVLQFAQIVDRGYGPYFNTLRTKSSMPAFK